MTFKVVIDGRDFARIPQPTKDWQVRSLSWNAYGGADEATLTLRDGSLGARRLAQLLGCPVRIFSRHDEVIWGGTLHSVTGGDGAEWCMAHLHNRVCVRYNLLTPDGGSALTDWAEDLRSQSLYGVHEQVFTRWGVDQAVAETLRDGLLAEHAWVRARWGETGGTLRITCRGWMHSLGWKCAPEEHGSFGNPVGVSGSQPLGDATTRTRVAALLRVQTPLDLQVVELKLRREGSPTDDLLLSVQSDSAGAPSGSVLAQASLSGSTLASEGLPWVRFTFDPPFSLDAQTDTWLVLQRSAGVNAGAYYLLGVDEMLSDASSKLRVYDGGLGLWGLRSPNGDLVWRALGVRELAEQVADLFAHANQRLSGLQVEGGAGLATPPAFSPGETCLEALQRLLRLGGWTAKVRADRRLVVAALPAQGDADWGVDAAGGWLDERGNPVLAGRQPVGRWLQQGEAPRRGEACAFVERVCWQDGTWQVG